MTEEEKVPRLTPAMRWVLIGAGTVVVVGAIVASVLLMSGGTGGVADAGGTPSRAATPTQGPLPDATPTTGSEVIAPTEAPPTTLPPVPPAAPVITPPYPESATADGELAAGFPADVIPPAPSSDVQQSAIATEGDVMQATLVARTDSSTDDVRAFYAARWTGLGLTDQGPNADGSLTFRGTGASVSLAFATSGTGTRYTVFGVFRAS